MTTKQKKIEEAFYDKFIESKLKDLRNIRPYLHRIDDLKKSGKWKIHLTMKIHPKPSKDSDMKHLMHSKSDNEEIMSGFDKEVFQSLLQ